MKYIIWGTGPYCKEKIKYINADDIIAYVERKKIMFRGKETILPEEIVNYQYDKVIIMSNHYLEIIPELLAITDMDPNKIVPGIACRPYLFGELELMSNNSVIKVQQDGTLLYIYDNKIHFTIAREEDWIQVRNALCHEENSKKIKELDVEPIGKLFGLQRGGSICRYYIDKFLGKYRSEIKGKVLEIGDRTYTNCFKEKVEQSYCLHFDQEFEEEGLDFYGDLRDGTGLKKEYFDCIILTQVLNFIEDIRYTPRALVDSLKPGGVLLITVSGITPISRADMNRWGHFWNFTDAGIRQMFDLENTECSIETYGNYKVACAFLGGMSYTELSEEELNYVDEDFQVFVMAMVRRKQ